MKTGPRNSKHEAAEQPSIEKRLFGSARWRTVVHGGGFYFRWVRFKGEADMCSIFRHRPVFSRLRPRILSFHAPHPPMPSVLRSLSRLRSPRQILSLFRFLVPPFETLHLTGYLVPRRYKLRIIRFPNWHRGTRSRNANTSSTSLVILFLLLLLLSSRSSPRSSFALGHLTPRCVI